MSQLTAVPTGKEVVFERPGPAPEGMTGNQNLRNLFVNIFTEETSPYPWYKIQTNTRKRLIDDVFGLLKHSGWTFKLYRKLDSDEESGADLNPMEALPKLNNFCINVQRGIEDKTEPCPQEILAAGFPLAIATQKRNESVEKKMWLKNQLRDNPTIMRVSVAFPCNLRCPH